MRFFLLIIFIVVLPIKSYADEWEKLINEIDTSFRQGRYEDYLVLSEKALQYTYDHSGSKTIDYIIAIKRVILANQLLNRDIDNKLVQAIVNAMDNKPYIPSDHLEEYNKHLAEIMKLIQNEKDIKKRFFFFKGSYNALKYYLLEFFYNYEWDYKNLEYINNKISNVINQEFNFLGDEKDLLYVFAQDTSKEICLFFTIFWRLNFFKWYPSNLLKTIVSDMDYKRISDLYDSVKDIKVTKTRWYTDTINYQKTKLILSTNIGTGIELKRMMAMINVSDDIELILQYTKCSPEEREFLKKSYTSFESPVFQLNKMGLYKKLMLDFFHITNVFTAFVNPNTNYPIPKVTNYEDIIRATLQRIVIVELLAKLRFFGDRSVKYTKLKSKSQTVKLYFHRDKTDFKDNIMTHSHKRNAYKNKKGEVHQLLDENMLNFELDFFTEIYAKMLFPPNSFLEEFGKKRISYFIDNMKLNTRLAGLYTHELDHSLFFDKDLPLWLNEGQATYYGEFVSIGYKIGEEFVKEGFIDRVFSTTNDSTSISSDSLNPYNIINFYKAHYNEHEKKALTDNEVKYIEIIKSKENLLKEIRNLFLIDSPKLFYDKRTEKWNYALSWAIFKTIKYAENENAKEWNTNKKYFYELVNQSYEVTSSKIVTGYYDNFIKWLISQFDVSLNKSLYL